MSSDTTRSDGKLVDRKNERDNALKSRAGQTFDACAWGLLEPAAADRVPLRQGTGDVATPEPKAPTGSAGCTEHDYVDGVYEEDFPKRQGPMTDCGTGVSTELLCIDGGAGGQPASTRSRR